MRGGCHFLEKKEEKEYHIAMIYVSNSPTNTQKIATDLLHKLCRIKTKGGVVIALEGELGAGKTVFVKGFAKALGVKEKIKSPTFVLMRKYKIPQVSSSRSQASSHLYHLDCYRLRDEKDLETLGIKEVLSNPENIVMIEWSDRVKKILPRKHIKVHIDHVSSKERKIIIKF